MALISQAMTSTDDQEIKWCLVLIVRSSTGTGLMHEAFDVDDLNMYTRCSIAAQLGRCWFPHYCCCGDDCSGSDG